jgi:beta-lactamase regulating signal transducer with metallopeptidase domain
MKINSLVLPVTVVSLLCGYLAFSLLAFLPYFHYATTQCYASIPYSVYGISFLVCAFVLFALLKISMIIRTTSFLSKKYSPSSEKYACLESFIDTHNLSEKLVIYENTVPYAFCLGISKPKIYLSTGLLKILDQQELEAVILHEQYHLISLNNLSLLLLNFFQYILLPFPLVRDVIRTFELKEEIQADAYAISIQNTNRYILSALRKLLVIPSLPTMAYAVQFAKWNNIETRIYTMVGRKPALVANMTVKNVLLTVLSVMILSSIVHMAGTQKVNGQTSQAVTACLSPNKSVFSLSSRIF